MNKKIIFANYFCLSRTIEGRSNAFFNIENTRANSIQAKNAQIHSKLARIAFQKLPISIKQQSKFKINAEAK